MATTPRTRPGRLPPEIFDLPVEKMREGYYTDAYFNHTRETLLAGRSPAARRDAGVPAQPRDARRHRRGDRRAEALLGRLGCAHRPRAPRRRPDRAVGDGDDDRGRLHPLRAPRDRLSRRPDAADADHDQHRPRRRGGERQADHLHAGAARPPPRSDRRRLRGLRRGRDDRRRDRRHLRRSGVLVGRPRRRHRAARADRLVRRQHRSRSDEVRRVGAART